MAALELSADRRRLVVALLAAMCAALSLLLLGGIAAAQAQQAQPLVSNIEQHHDTSVGLSGKDLAQSFTTGTTALGYHLTSLELNLEVGSLLSNTTTHIPTVTLHRDAPTGPKVADFIGPAALPVNIVDVYYFRPTTIVLLEELTTYWVVAESSGVVIAS